MARAGIPRRASLHDCVVSRKLVAEGQKRGEFRQDADGDVGARLLVSGLMVQLMWQQHADAVPAVAVDEDRLIDSSVELFLASLGRGERRGPRVA
jgi:hypothetical protein